MSNTSVPGKSSRGAGIFRSALLNAARKRYANLQSNGLVAAISPCPMHLIDMCLSAVALQSGDVLVDLGCGDGRWLYSACHIAACVAVGVEKDTERLSTARAMLTSGNPAYSDFSSPSPVVASASNPQNAEKDAWAQAQPSPEQSPEYSGRWDLIGSDFLHVSVAWASVVVVYLSREGMAQLRLKLEQECSPGTRVVAIGFQMAGWVVAQTLSASGAEGCHKGMQAYIYQR